MKLTHRIHVCLIIFFNSLFQYNEFTEIRQDSLNFDLIMNPTHYESISVAWAIQTDLKRKHGRSQNLKQVSQNFRKSFDVDDDKLTP